MSIDERLDRIEGLLRLLVRQSPRDYYSTEEFALRVGLAAYTVASIAAGAGSGRRRSRAAAASSRRGP